MIFKILRELLARYNEFVDQYYLVEFESKNNTIIKFRNVINKLFIYEFKF